MTEGGIFRTLSVFKKNVPAHFALEAWNGNSWKPKPLGRA